MAQAQSEEYMEWLEEKREIELELTELLAMLKMEAELGMRREMELELGLERDMRREMELEMRLEREMRRLREQSRRRSDSSRYEGSMKRTHEMKQSLIEAVGAGRMSQEEADREFDDFIDQMVRREIAHGGRGIMERDDVEALFMERLRETEREYRFRLANEKELLELLYDIERNTRQ
ncbi:MAG: hypothetical protein CMJ40_01160 [Phycisphaerae bacterium]|nr:hypothetical protein [Phycisphaerae bacterium]